MMKKEKTFLTVEQIAMRLGVTVSTVYRLAREGELPGFKVGNQWRFEEGMMMKWVKNRVEMRRLGEAQQRERDGGHADAKGA